MTLAEIIAAVNGTLRSAKKNTKFADVPVEAEDVSKEIKRPSIKVEVIPTYSKEMQMSVTSAEVEVFFYAEESHDWHLDCVKMQDVLGVAILEGILTDYGTLEVTDVDCSINSGILALNFTITDYSIATEDGDTIDTLEWRN